MRPTRLGLSASCSAKGNDENANAAALVWHSVPELNWAGFYLRRSPDELVLGPFQGKPACVRIAVGRGNPSVQKREPAVRERASGQCLVHRRRRLEVRLLGGVDHRIDDVCLTTLVDLALQRVEFLLAAAAATAGGASPGGQGVQILGAEIADERGVLHVFQWRCHTRAISRHPRRTPIARLEVVEVRARVEPARVVVEHHAEAFPIRRRRAHLVVTLDLREQLRQVVVVDGLDGVGADAVEGGVADADLAGRQWPGLSDRG